MHSDFSLNNILYFIVTQLPSLERWALLPFWDFLALRPTLMHTKNLYENGPNPFFFFGTKNMSEGHLMRTVLVCYFFDKLGQACLCG